jgi:hypothetical protein
MYSVIVVYTRKGSNARTNTSERVEAKSEWEAMEVAKGRVRGKVVNVDMVEAIKASKIGK